MPSVPNTSSESNGLTLTICANSLELDRRLVQAPEFSDPIPRC
ncbi:hypothetical protein NSK11_contig00253-0003, partial [Nocardia seriolae]